MKTAKLSHLPADSRIAVADQSKKYLARLHSANLIRSLRVKVALPIRFTGPPLAM